MKITVNADLSSILTTDDGALECRLPNYNPETLVPFASREAVETYAYSIEGRPFFFQPKKPAEEVLQESRMSVSRRQGRLALLKGGYLDAVETAIAAITDPIERQAARIEYEADTWDRGNTFLQEMWLSLGGNAAGLDDLFRLAATL